MKLTLLCSDFTSLMKVSSLDILKKVQGLVNEVAEHQTLKRVLCPPILDLPDVEYVGILGTPYLNQGTKLAAWSN